ncbi:MAG: fibronectin type III domain-containing protein, partial [Chitinophagaceae bacterium]|nr:fibronectin type III domain-containing protein [Chitinophagaceae bacterium]
MSPFFFLSFVFLFFILGKAGAQNSSNYTFSTNNNGSLALDMNGNTVDMTTGTTVLLGPGLSGVANSQMPMGFDFWLMGTRHTTFNVTTHGLIGLSTNVSTGNNIGGGTGARLGAFVNGTSAANMATSATGKVHCKVIGTAPNRTLVVEWLNMSINNSSTNADATFQVRLYETTNVVELMYGAMSITSGGPYTTVRAGFSTNSSANTFQTVNLITHVTSALAGTDNTFSTGVMTTLNSVANGNRRYYRYVPNATTAPTGINFTSVTASSITVNWTDNATDELGYAIYRSDDGGTTYSLQTLTAANVNNFVGTGLLAASNYVWRVNAVREAPGTALEGNQSTTASTPVSTTGSGLWSSPATWSSGIVPTISDAVTIAAGHTVTIDIAGFAYSVAIDGTLEFEQTTARSLSVSESVTINSSGIFQSNAAGTQTNHSVTIGQNLVNNGILDFSTNSNTAGAGIIFNSTLQGVFTLGSTSTTDLRTVTLSKGSNPTAKMVFTPDGTFTVLGATTAGFLGLGTGGTFEIAGTATFSNPVFSSAAYSIPSTCSFRLNNPNATVVGQNGSPNTSGTLRISQGTFNVGTASGNSMGFAANSIILVEGGFVNTTGRFGVAAASNNIYYTQTAGTITVNTIGHTSTTLAGFDLGTSSFSNINISGGTIVVQTNSTAASGPRDYRMQAGQGGNSITGGALQIGNASSGAAKTFNIMGATGNLIITNTSANHTCVFGTPGVVSNSSRNVTIQTGTTLNIGANIFIIAGATLTNDGILNGSATGARLFWSGTGVAQTYTGTGTVSPLLQSFEVDNALGLTIDPSVSNLEVARIALFTGNITNTNKLTLGNGGTSSGTIQFGNTTTPTAAGNFDVSPTFNIGSGGLNISYLRETNPRSTGFEINPSRTLNNLTIDNTLNALTVTGGSLSVSGILTLTNGRVNTNASNLITVTNTTVNAVAGGSTTSFINGPFERTLPASLLSGTTYIFPVGKTTYGVFELVNPTTNAGGNVVIRTESFESNSGGTPGTGLSALNSNRYWESSLVSGAANFTNSTVRLTDPSISLAGGNRIGQSATVNGTYLNIGSTISGNTIASTTTPTSLGFFNIALTDQILVGGTYPVGNSAPTYQKLTQVAAALSTGVVTGNIVFEMQPDYDGTLGETFPINFVPISKSGGNWNIRIRPQSGATGLVTSGDPGSGNPLIILNGVDSLTFDGRPNGSGTTSEWTFRNTRNTASIGGVFVFQNGASVDTLEYLKIEGQNTAAAQASVLFSTTTTTGNSNNVLLANDIRDRSDVLGVPHTLIASIGTAGQPNNGNKISGNTLRNFTSNGIAVSSNSNNWVVGGNSAAEGNHIFQEAQRIAVNSHINFTTGDAHLIGFNSIYQTAGLPNTAAMNCINVTGGGNGHVIRNNSIGGSNASRTGSVLAINVGSTINGILVNVGANTATQIYNNTISNFGNLFSSGTIGVANGILVSGGLVNIGGLGGNTIGGAVVTGVPSDTLITMYDNGWINVSGGTVTIENNLITNGSYYRNANDRNSGITINGGSQHIVRNNTIRALKGNSAAALPTAFTQVGMYIATTGTLVEGNTIDDIRNINPTFAGPSAIGINWNALNGSMLRNKITNVYSTEAQTGTSAPQAYGMYIAQGAPVIANNMISLGANSTNEVRVAGIVSAGSTNPGPQVVYNTIYLNGTNTGGSNKSYGYLRSSTTGNTLRNNLISNERSGGTGAHFAIGNTTSVTNWTASASDYNDLYTTNPSTVGEWLLAPLTLAGWQAAQPGGSGGDANSFSELPTFVNPASDLHLNMGLNVTQLESGGITIAGVTTDYDGTTRPNPTPVNGGSNAPDVGADEFDGVPVPCVAAVGGTASGNVTFCDSGIPTITNTGYSFGSGTTYQWYSSANSGDYPNGGTAISGQTNPASLTTGTISSTTYYWLRVTCATDASTDYSTMVTVTVIPFPIVSAGSNASICPGGSYTLSGMALNQSSVVWSSAGDGTFDNTGILGATYTPGPTDISNGSVVLSLHANSISPCTTTAGSSMTLSIVIPAMPTLACYETATFNTTTCVWDVTGSMPAMPTLACYETASFNTTTCVWDVTGSQPAMPTLACYQTASFNTTTCVWDVTGTMPAMPTLACYQTASFNTTTCVWDVTGSPNPPLVTSISACGMYYWAITGLNYTTTGTYTANVG